MAAVAPHCRPTAAVRRRVRWRISGGMCVACANHPGSSGRQHAEHDAQPHHPRHPERKVWPHGEPDLSSLDRQAAARTETGTPRGRWLAAPRHVTIAQAGAHWPPPLCASTAGWGAAQVASLAMIPANDARVQLYQMLKAGFVALQVRAPATVPLDSCRTCAESWRRSRPGSRGACVLARKSRGHQTARRPGPTFSGALIRTARSAY